MIGDKYTKFSASGISRSTATLMKTGQTTSFRTGDDGDLQAGRGVDFFTLAENNPFGNTNRFTDELGGSTYANNIVIDWSTYNGSNVLGYYRTVMANAIWDTQIDNCLAVSIGSFTSGWRLWNVLECVNILNFGIGDNSLNYAPFNSTNGSYFHTSTSRDGSYNMKRIGMQFFLDPNQNSAYGMAVRTFTVTGTTLS